MSRWEEIKKNAIPPTSDPFPISEWRKYWRTRSRYWVYFYNNQHAKACKTLEEAQFLAQSQGGRWFGYDEDSTVEAVLRNMS